MRFPRACVFLLVALGHTGCPEREAPSAPKLPTEEPQPSPPKPITATTATTPTKARPRVATAGTEGDKPTTGDGHKEQSETGGGKEADKNETKPLEKHVGREENNQAVAPPRIAPSIAPKRSRREPTPKPLAKPAPPRVPSTRLEPERRGGGATYRAGALRLSGSAKSVYSLRYFPSSGLGLPKLARKLNGRTPEAEVTPFRQLATASAEVQPVERGGEIVAIALALQLERLGWRVNVAGKELLARGLPIPGSPIASTGFRIDGEVRFESGAEAARIAGTVRFLRQGAVLATIRAEVQGSATASEVRGAGAPTAYERRRQAAEQALSRFVAAVLGDRLDRALAAAAP